ncbi:MAG: NAD(P)-dependent glycerol-1-phosphate dehydrogenase [Candidatus Thermoplasmatota archaeon]|nr:NAD(P)-dependent glycerol-1-phosphate dehydrogenase [Candidatus Thermoplasmatota archaeon]
MDESFSKAKAMVFPRNVLAGHGVLEDIGEMARTFGIKGKAVIITGKTTRKLAGEKVYTSLLDKGYSGEFLETGPATMDNVEEAIAHSKPLDPNFIVGVGGGSKIDISKMVALELGLPFISVPTSAAHDGIASPRASIKSNGRSKSIKAKVPMGVVADTEILSKAPYRSLASGCADVISNINAIQDWKLANRLRGEPISTFAITMAEMTAAVILENAKSIKPNLEESVWIAIRPLIVSGVAMSVAGTSRPTSGSEHMFSHALDTIAPGKAMHGEQCGVGTILMTYLHGGDWQRIRNALLDIGAPTSARGLGVDDEDIINSLVMAHTIRPERYTILGDKGLTMEAAQKLAVVTKVT